MADAQTEWFTTWGGRVLGIFGLAAAALVVGLGVTGIGGDYHPAVYSVSGLFAVLVWITMLRPAVGIRDDLLVLRNPLTTVTIPLAAVQQVAVGQYLAVLVGGHRFTNSGIGRGRFAARRDDQVSGTSPQRSFGGLIEARLRHQAQDARARHGVEERSEEQEALAADVRREPARLEIALLAALVLIVVVTFVV